MLEIIGIEVNIVEVIEGILRIETGHMMQAESGIEMTVEDLGQVEERVDLEIEIGLTVGTKVRREGVITAESQDLRQYQKKKRD